MKICVICGSTWARNLGQRVPLDGRGAGLAVLHSGKPLVIEETGTWQGWDAWNSTQVVRSWLGVPLVRGDGVIGVLNLESTTARAFLPSQADLLMAFADQAAIAVVNARLYQQAQDSAAANERQRLARDLHDAVTQTTFFGEPGCGLVAGASQRHLARSAGRRRAFGGQRAADHGT